MKKPRKMHRSRSTENAKRRMEKEKVGLIKTPSTTPQNNRGRRA